MLEITSALQFKQCIGTSARPVVIDCWAPWCGPCRMLAPTFAKIATEYPNALFAKLNIDDVQEVASALDISCIPTILVFVEGAEVERCMGGDPAKIRAAIEKHL